MHDDWKPIYTALAADIMDQMGHRDQAMDSGIRPALPESSFAGPAVTLNAVTDSSPSDDPYGKIFEAYELMSPGDVVVIATNGETRSGLWGELLSTAAAYRGVKSVVTDGLVRDIRQMNDMGFACFSRGYSPLDSAGRCFPTEVNGPIRCGGVCLAGNPHQLCLPGTYRHWNEPRVLEGESRSRAIDASPIADRPVR